MTPPRITVLLPVHNGMPFLQTAISSLLAQTEKNILVLVLDDGSDDASVEFVKGLNDHKIQVLSPGKMGLPSILNYGLGRVTTEYLARMDADDVCSEGRLEAQSAFLDSHPRCVLVGGCIRYLSDDGSRTSWRMNVPSQHEDIMHGMRSRRSVIYHPTIMCRTQALRTCGGYDPDTFPAEDYDLYFRLSRVGELANLTTVVLDMRVHGESVVSQRLQSSLEQYSRSIQRHAGVRYHWAQRFYYAFDGCSAVLYRKGLAYYLNSTRLVGLFFFFLALIVNPYRLFRFIHDRFVQ